MLAFDIETTGLSDHDKITAASVYDPKKNIHETFLFHENKDPSKFLAYLDEADVLCAFNGARFDIPFIQKQWNLPTIQVQGWILKLVDIYDMCFHVFKRGFSLNQLLLANNIDCKTGTGKEAIDLALNQKWKELADYCMQDTIKTYTVTNMTYIEIPLLFANERVFMRNLEFCKHGIKSASDQIDLQNM
jgi:DNA polymerase elongation subunit (family B)